MNQKILKIKYFFDRILRKLHLKEQRTWIGMMYDFMELHKDKFEPVAYWAGFEHPAVTYARYQFDGIIPPNSSAKSILEKEWGIKPNDQIRIKNLGGSDRNIATH